MNSDHSFAMDEKERERLEIRYTNELNRRLKRVTALDILKSKRIYRIAMYSSGAIVLALAYMCFAPPDVTELFLSTGEYVFKLYSKAFTHVTK